MTEAVGVTVRFTPMTELDKPARGWCPTCNLPSTIVWLFAVEINGHLPDGKLASQAICTECQAVTWDQ